MILWCSSSSLETTVKSPLGMAECMVNDWMMSQQFMDAKMSGSSSHKMGRPQSDWTVPLQMSLGLLSAFLSRFWCCWGTCPLEMFINCSWFSLKLMGVPLQKIPILHSKWTVVDIPKFPGWHDTEFHCSQHLTRTPKINGFLAMKMISFRVGLWIASVANLYTVNKDASDQPWSFDFHASIGSESLHLLKPPKTTQHDHPKLVANSAAGCERKAYVWFWQSCVTYTHTRFENGLCCQDSWVSFSRPSRALGTGRLVLLRKT